MKAALFAILLVAGCIVGESTPPGGGGGGGGGDGTGEGDGTGGGNGNGSGSASNMSPDGGVALPACTKAAYDPCTSAADCTSGNCKAFAADGIQVCTQTCTPGDNTTCPMQNGQPATCNNMGICKPPAANACMP